MELDVSKLAADGLRLQFDGPGEQKRCIVLTPSSGVTGRYATDARAYHIDATSEAELSFSEVFWPTETVGVSLHGARLDRAAVDLKIRRKGGTSGQIGAREIGIDKLEITPDGVDKPIVLRKMVLDRPGLALGDKALAVVCQRASIERVELHLMGLEIVLHGVNLTGVRLRRGQGVWLILAESLSARRIAIQRGEMTFIAENVEAQTVGVDGKVIRVARVFAPRAHMSGARLASRATEAPPPSEPPKRWDLAALDGLDGKVDVDLTVDATLPVIGGRRATHHFRLPIDSGTLNFHRLEKSLSALEDAVLDFAVRGNDLVLERDIPLMKKVLVSWPLDSRDMALAERQLVRVARLLDYRVEGKDDGDGGKSAVELRELSFDGLDVELALAGGAGLDLPGGGRVELGEDGRPALDQLIIKGALRHTPGPAGRTELDSSASMLNIGLGGLPVGGRAVSISAVTVGSLEKGSIRFVGLQPDGVDATLRDVEILSVRLMPR